MHLLPVVIGFFQDFTSGHLGSKFDTHEISSYYLLMKGVDFLRRWR